MSSSKGIPLEEDVYTEALSHVIERDFFPDLKILNAEASFLDALDSQDLIQIRLQKERLENIGRPVSPPTLVSTFNEDEHVLVNTQLSIDQFQAKYTSEDNASFHHLLDETNKKLRSKLAWMFNDEKKNQPTITDGSEKEQPAQVITYKSSGKNSLMFSPSTLTHPTSSLATLSDSITHDSNSTVSPPMTASDSILKRTSTTSDKRVQHHATRFNSATPLAQLLETQSMPFPSPMVSSTLTSTSSSTPYSLVSMTPIPTLHEDAPPTLTWGSIEATPVPVQDTPLRYHVPATPKREALLNLLTNPTSVSSASHPNKRRKFIQKGDSMLRASYGRDPKSNSLTTPSMLDRLPEIGSLLIYVLF
ncbi:DiGeorge syndrome critical region protein 14 [Coelomomyces lativittatus]|nr:DiGeorge syndrome critical region protein 14 [Coelomomyces lativittatus]